MKNVKWIMAQLWCSVDSAVGAGNLEHELFDVCPYERGHSLKVHNRTCVTLAKEIAKEHNTYVEPNK